MTHESSTSRAMKSAYVDGDNVRATILVTADSRHRCGNLSQRSPLGSSALSGSIPEPPTPPGTLRSANGWARCVNRRWLPQGRFL
jgi:hypothetical protein